MGVWIRSGMGTTGVSLGVTASQLYRCRPARPAASTVGRTVAGYAGWAAAAACDRPAAAPPKVACNLLARRAGAPPRGAGAGAGPSPLGSAPAGRLGIQDLGARACRRDVPGVLGELVYKF